MSISIQAMFKSWRLFFTPDPLVRALTEMKLTDAEHPPKFHEGRLALSIFPRCLVFMRHVHGAVRVHCETFPEGPGFHRHFIDLMVEIATRLRARMYIQDETGYVQHRDFARLQQSYSQALAQLGERAATEGNGALVGWTEAWTPDISEGVVTRQGWYSAASFASAAALPNAQLSERFFTWPYATRDATFYRNRALRFYYTQFTARTDAQTPESGTAMRNAQRQSLECLEQASRMDPRLALPRACYAQLCAALGVPEQPLPNPDLALEREQGFRFGHIVAHYEGWRCTLPGHFSALVDERNRLCAQDARTTIALDPRARAFTLDPEMDLLECAGHRYYALMNRKPSARMLEGWVVHEATGRTAHLLVEWTTCEDMNVAVALKLLHSLRFAPRDEEEDGAS